MAVYYATSLITGNTAAAALTGTQPLRRPPPTSRSGAEVQSVRGILVFASGTDLVINDVIELAILPADHVIVGWELWNDDFDSAASFTTKIGLMTGEPGDASRLIGTVGVELLASGSTVMQAAAVTRGSVVASIAGMRTAGTPSTSNRGVGMAVVAAPTNPATIRQLDFVLQYRAAHQGA